MEKIFNIFLSVSIKDLPSDIKSFMPKELQELQLSSLILIGSGGPQMWTHFKNYRSSNQCSMDHFSQNVIIAWGKKELNEDLTEQFLYPNDVTHFPLQKLARHLKLTHQSPLGIDISQNFGLWFAFRALVATKNELPFEMPLKESQPFLSPCESCSDKPCLSEMKNISKARLLCPYQSQMRYSDEQISFHENFIARSLFPPQS